MNVSEIEAHESCEFIHGAYVVWIEGFVLFGCEKYLK